MAASAYTSGVGTLTTTILANMNGGRRMVYHANPRECLLHFNKKDCYWLESESSGEGAQRNGFSYQYQAFTPMLSSFGLTTDLCVRECDFNALGMNISQKLLISLFAQGAQTADR